MVEINIFIMLTRLYKLKGINQQLLKPSQFLIRGFTSDKLTESQFEHSQISKKSITSSMDQFARKSFQRSDDPKASKQQRMKSSLFKSQQGQSQKQSQSAEKPSENQASIDQLAKAYLNTFNKSKSELIQEWLAMSNESLVSQCKIYNLPVSQKQYDNMQQLFAYLNDFEAEQLRNVADKNQQPKEDGVMKKFGKNKQQKIDEWLELTNSELMDECKKYQLAVSDKHIHNIQTLFNFLKVFEDPKVETKQSLPQFNGKNESVSNTLNMNNPFLQKKIPIFSNREVANLAVKDLQEDINKMFSRKKDLQQNKYKPQSQIEQQVVTKTGPLVDLPRQVFGKDELLKSLTNGTVKLNCVDLPQSTNNIGEFQFRPKQFQSYIDSYLQKSNVIKRVSEFKPEQLDKEFEKLENCGDLQKFKNLTGPQKKQILVKSITLRELRLQTEHNAMLEHLIANNSIDIFVFANKHFDNLNQTNRDSLKQILGGLSKQSLKQIQEKFSEIKQMNAVVSLVEKLKTSLSENIQPEFLFEQSLYQIRKGHSDVLDQVIDLANTIALLNEMKEGGIGNQFINQMQSKVLDLPVAILLKISQNMTPSQAQNLIYVMPDTYSIEQVLQNDLSQLSTNKILYLTERAVALNNNLINNQLMTSLSKINGTRYSLDEISALIGLLTPLKNRADLNLVIGNLLMSRPMFQIATGEEFTKIIDIFEKTLQSQPFSFTKLRMELRHFIVNSMNLVKKERIPLQQMVRLAAMVNSSMIKPSFLFTEMLESGESFAKDVTESQLIALLNPILERLQQHKVTFEHLQSSISIYHRQFVPFTKETFKLLKKIITDGVPQHVVNRILADQFVYTRIFTSSEQARKVLVPMLNSIEANSNESENSDLIQFKDAFAMLGNVCKIIPGDDTQKTVGNIIEKFLHNLSIYLQKGLNENNFKLTQLLELNSYVLNAINNQESNVEHLLTIYKTKLPLCNIIINLNDHHTAQSSTKSVENLVIADAIKNSKWSQIERSSGDFIKFYLTHLEKNLDQNLNLNIKDFLLQLTNIRSLYGENLADLFKLIEQLDAKQLANPSDFDQLLMNVAINLKTIGVNLFNLPQEEDQEDLVFKSQNTSMLDSERKLKQMILQRYIQINKRSPDLFVAPHKFILSPLSSLMAELFDSFEHQNVLECMNLLGSNDIDNYSEDFILKLYENYAQQAFMAQMYAQNPKFFFEFSKAWPQFLKNNAILNQLTRVKGVSILVSDQSETIQILTQRNVLHPELMNLHLDTFIRMKDKDLVAKYLKQFIQSAAYFGYTKNVNIEQITQVYRRIHKSPSECQIEELLNFLVLVAVSNSYYGDFDEKSKTFIDQALDIIEEQFTGTQFVVASRFKDVKQSKKDALKQSGEPSLDQDFKLTFFKQILTSNKTYNKQAVRKLTDEFVEETERARSTHFTGSAATPYESESEADDEVLEPSENGDQLRGIGGDSNTHSQQKASGRKTYQRQGSESHFQEDNDYLQFRNKKLAQMDKKGKHLLMYSNINQLNYVDINHLTEAKAWTILFHFRAKSLQSMLFEEFNSVCQRNAIGKTKNHKLFGDFYLKMMEESYKTGLQIKMANSCERTGWPIDISLKPRQVSSQQQNESEVNNQSQAIYFMLQEELCYNAQTKAEEPLGLQKLMVRQLQTISDYKVHFVTESEVVANMDSAVHHTLAKMNPAVSDLASDI